MAQMKKLNGYEIVDQNARDTKQNKVLTGSSDPSNTIGSNGDLYISTNGVDIINDLQSQITTNKNNIATKLTAKNFSFGQYNSSTSAATLQFSGTCFTRTVNAIILISGQGGPIPPVLVSFSHGGSVHDYINVSDSDAMISDNNYNITGGSNATVNIPANIKSGWGNISVLVLDGSLSVSISYS